MTDHAREVRNLLTDARQLVTELGWAEGAKPSGGGMLIRCPSHQDRNPSCSVTKGEDGTLRAVCHACQWSADALGMIALAHSLSTSTAQDFRDILAIGAEIGGDLRLADEIRDGAQPNKPPRTPVPAPEPEPAREYPDPAEVAELWTTSGSCQTDADAEELLRSRSIDPVAATELGLARAISPRGATLPSWATYRGFSWAASGHRLVVRVFDAAGRQASVRSWQVDGHDGPKRLPPAGKKAAGLVMANAQAVRILRGQAKPGRVLICEGEPDWLTWATRVGAEVAVFGIGSGSWTREHANKIPRGSDVLILTHLDQAGDKYAAHVSETIAESSQVWRVTGLRGVDENDKAKAGKLPADPFEKAEPVNEAAKKAQSERPRVLTVQQILLDSHSRAVSKEVPKVLTTGHWKIDMLTGGIRKGFSWLMGAPTSWGKSSWSIAVVDENLKRGARVLIVSTEDDESVYGDRLMARRSGVEARRIRDRRLAPEDYSAITAVVEAGEKIPVYLDGRGVTWERLLKQAEHVVDNEGIDLVILDYVQECTTKQKYGDDRLMFKAIGQQFRHAFKTRGISSLMLSQLTISDPSKPPTNRDVRDCKDLSMGAEVIVLGWSPDKPVVDGDVVKYEAGSRVLIVDKSKDGMKGSAALDWDQRTASFRRVVRPIDEEGYDIPGFARDDFDDLDNQFEDAF